MLLFGVRGSGVFLDCKSSTRKLAGLPNAFLNHRRGQAITCFIFSSLCPQTITTSFAFDFKPSDQLREKKFGCTTAAPGSSRRRFFSWKKVVYESFTLTSTSKKHADFFPRPTSGQGMFLFLLTSLSLLIRPLAHFDSLLSIPAVKAISSGLGSRSSVSVPAASPRLQGFTCKKLPAFLLAKKSRYFNFVIDFSLEHRTHRRLACCCTPHDYWCSPMQLRVHARW